MKKILIILSFAFYINFQAQEIKEVYLFQESGNAIITFTIDNISVSMNTDGELLALRNFKSSKENKIYTNLRVSGIPTDVDLDYNRKGFIELQCVNDNIQYYDGFHDYEEGKLKSINQVSFTYYDSFHSYDKGKLKSIGKIKLEYNDHFHSYDKGKLKSINGISFVYFDNFNKYKAGKLKSIKGNKKNIAIGIINR